MGNGSSTNSRRTRGKPSKAPSSSRSIEPQYVPIRKVDTPTTKIDMVDLGVYYSEQLGNNNTQLYSDDTFTNFIKSGKHKIRVMSTVGHHGRGREVSRDGAEGVAANAPTIHNSGSVNNDDHHFEEFIHRTRKKLRTTSRVGDSSFNRG